MKKKKGNKKEKEQTDIEETNPKNIIKENEELTEFVENP